MQLGPAVNHCHFAQGGLIYCCFCLAEAVLPYSCNSGWSAPPPARWESSVLSITLSPKRLAQWSTIAPLCEFGLLPHSHSQTLCLTSLPCSLIIPLLWEFGLLPQPCSQVLFLVTPSFADSSALFPCWW
jgi:hypothetical protein